MSEVNLKALAAPLPEDIEKCKWAGDFEAAKRLIERRLQNAALGELLRERLRLELTRLERLPNEFPYNRVQAIAHVREAVPDFTAEEFDALETEGWFDFIYVGGEKRYISSFRQTLLSEHSLLSLRAGGEVVDPDKHLLVRTMRRIRREGGLSCHYHIKMSLRVKDQFFVPGATYQVHLPLPRRTESIHDIRILDVQPAQCARINPEDAAARTVYFEARLEQNTSFTVEFEYDCSVKYVDVHRSVSGHVYELPPPTQEDLDELPPHIVFTPYLRDLARQLRGEETDPLRIAQCYYDYVTKSVRYAFMRSYLQYDHLAEYVAANLRGDCGAQTLLFMALCRISGIPTRWQSGWYANPEKEQAGSHDWAQFYAEPYGWLYADCSFGGGKLGSRCEDYRRFYFGNLDPFRMVANDGYAQALNPPCELLRDDPFDNQSGECACENRRFTFDELTVERRILAANVLSLQ